METSWTQERAVPARPVGPFWILLAGVLVGVLFLITIQLGTRWFFTLFVGGLILAVSLAPRNRKTFYLALLVFTIPIVVKVNLYFQRASVHHSTHGFLLLLYYLPLVALYIIWAGRCLLEHRPPGISTRGLGPLAAFFAAGVISVLLGGNVLFGAFDLFALLWSIALFIYASSEVRTKRDLQTILVALFVAVWVQGIIAVGQGETGSSLGLEFFGETTKLEVQQGPAPLTRVGGTIGHPNELARFFDLILPLGVSLLFCPLRWRTRLLLGTAVACGLLGLALTLSRSGLVVTAAACLLIFFVALQRRIGLLRALFAWALVRKSTRLNSSHESD
jgi:putative inorganic carbon (HCO3(-)) transporter